MAGYLFWLRDSPLVAINDVEVEGITGPEADEVTAALTESASEMTTLNLSEEKLEAATEAFPTVVSLTADPKLLHGLVIDVTERKPALTAHVAGQSIPVARDGTLLRGVELGDDGDALPVLELSALPRSPRLEGEALEQAVVLGAAPAAIRPLVEEVGVSGEDGVEVTLRGGIPVRLRDAVPGEGEMGCRRGDPRRSAAHDVHSYRRANARSGGRRGGRVADRGPERREPRRSHTLRQRLRVRHVSQPSTTGRACRGCMIPCRV